MTLVSALEAQQVYDSLPDDSRYAHFSPAYILADAKRDPDLKPTFFLYREEGGIFYHGFHVGSVPGTAFFDIQSAYGYGGPLVLAEDAGFPARAVARYREWCRDSRILVEFVRFHPGMKNHALYDGEVFHNRRTVWIDPSAPDPFGGYNPKTRTAVRKAQKSGLRVELAGHAPFLEYFVPLYHETMEHAGADGFYFFPAAYFEAVASLPAVRMLVFSGEHAVAGAIYLRSGKNMESHLTASNRKGRDMRAGHLIVHEMKRIGHETGCRYLNLGGGTDASEENPLLCFKKNFSPTLDDFYIGKFIVYPDEYEKKRREWEVSVGKRASRILFYL